MWQPVCLRQKRCFTPCKHTKEQKSTQADYSMFPHPKPRSRPVAACLKANQHLHRAREIAQGVLGQGWAHRSLSQTALVSLMAATQISRVKGETDLRCQGE
ncbi:hypothetical protein LDENG_00223010 [Lucifuga dentata]|nr:hypothetical protein LDENG_00223010 [Lucifuga dentata]